MTELRYRTAGESHGPALVVVVEGLPAGWRFDEALANAELARRQRGHGRSRRMALERDRVRVLAGLKRGVTLGSPLAILLENRDASIERLPDLRAPRPGHADLAGCLKYRTRDIRSVLERASARETAARVAAGAVARGLLAPFGIEIFGHVLRIGAAAARGPDGIPSGGPLDAEGRAWLEKARSTRDRSPHFTLDPESDRRAAEEVERAGAEGDTLGGQFEILAFGVPPGLGSYQTAEGRLDARLGAALLSIPAIKGVEIGEAFAASARRGSAVHDPIERRPGQGWGGWWRPTNRAGGIEGGVTNGQSVRVGAAMKPLPTLRRGLPSVNLRTGKPERGTFQRSDVCAVPAASVVGEAAVAFEIARAFLEKFGGDSLEEVAEAWKGHLGSFQNI